MAYAPATTSIRAAAAAATATTGTQQPEAARPTSGMAAGSSAGGGRGHAPTGGAGSALLHSGMRRLSGLLHTGLQHLPRPKKSTKTRRLLEGQEDSSLRKGSKRWREIMGRGGIRTELGAQEPPAAPAMPTLEERADEAGEGGEQKLVELSLVQQQATPTSNLAQWTASTALATAKKGNSNASL